MVWAWVCLSALESASCAMRYSANSTSVDQLRQPGIYILQGTYIVNDLHVMRVEVCPKIRRKWDANPWTQRRVAVEVKLEHKRFTCYLVDDRDSSAPAGDDLPDM